MKIRSNPFLRQATISVITLASSAFSAFAASATWNSPTNGNWINVNNWSPAAAPGAITGTTNADIATFDNLGYQIITLPTAENVGGITFATTGILANPFFLTGGTLLPSANAVIQTDSTYLGIADINTPITAQGNLTLTANGAAGSGLFIGNAFTTAASLGSVTLALNGSNSGFNGVFGNLITGVISQNVTGSTLKVSKSGTGTWTLSGANIYTGGTDLNGGMIVTNNATALGASGAIAVLGSTTVRTLAGLTDPSARISISDGATLTLNTSNVNQTWAGVLANSGASNTAGLTKTGLGSLTITPAPAAVQTWKGATTVNMGTLTLSGASQTANFTNLINSSSALVLGGGNINFTGKIGFTNSQTFNGTTLNAGVSGFIPAASTGTNTFDFGTITRNSGALLDITTAAGYTFNAGATANDAGGLVRGVLINGDFATSTAGTLGAVAYTTENAANLWASGTTNYINTTAVTGTANGTINCLKLNFAGDNSFAITGALSVNDGLLFGSTIGANASTISGGALTGPSGGGALIVVNNNASNATGRNTISSVIKDYATSDFAGAGTNGTTNLILYSRATNGALVLSGANTYTGTTYIGGGANAATGNMLTIVGVASGASIGSTGMTVFVNGGTGGSSNVLQVGNSDTFGDVKGTIQLDNGKLSLKRTDTFALSAAVAGTAGGGFISQDSTGTATVTLASGTNLFQNLSSTAAGTLNLGGTGTYYFNSAATGFNAGSTTNFNSGVYYFTSTGNTANTIGNWAINGATVTLGGGRFSGNAGGSLTLNSGTFRVMGNPLNNENGPGPAFTFNIAGGNFITTPNSNSGGTYSWGLGAGTAGSTSAATANQTGGAVTVGSPENSNVSNSFNALQIGPGAPSSHASTYNLSGGTLRLYGGVQGGFAAGVSGSNNFNWTGGTLTTGSYNATNLTSNDGISAAATGTLFQGGSTSILAPGESFNGYNFGGKTTITGNYKIDGGSVSLGIGGTTAAGTFHDTTAKFDNLTATGTVELGGTLNIFLRNGFTPANLNTFTIVTGTGGVSGTFTNLSGGKVTLTGGATFDVTTVGGNTVVLSNYTAAPSNTYASWIAGFSVGGQTLPNDDFDNDNLDNAVEHVLGSNPSVYSDGLTQISATASSVKFRHNQSNTIASDVTATYQWSPDLVTWAASGVSIAGTTATIGAVTITDVVAPANDLIEVTITVTGGPATKVFGRLVATKAP